MPAKQSINAPKRRGRPRSPESAEAQGPYATSFQDLARELREGSPARLTQRGLDKLIGRPGYTGQMEVGSAPPPSRDLCTEIADHLQLSRSDTLRLWDAAAAALLERLDRTDNKEIVKWHDAAVHNAAQGISPSDRTLITAVQKLGSAAGWAWARTVMATETNGTTIAMAAAGDSAATSDLQFNLGKVLWILGTRDHVKRIGDDDVMPPEATARERVLSTTAIHRLFANLAALPPAALIRVVSRFAALSYEFCEDFGVQGDDPSRLEKQMLARYTEAQAQGWSVFPDAMPDGPLADALARAAATADMQIETALQLFDEAERELREALLR